MAGARHYKELIVWQLADEMRVAVFALTRRAVFERDYKLRSQTDDAIDSVCRNIAEGFGCRSRLEFARFLEFSRRSLNEVMDGLRSAQLKEYVTQAEIEPIHKLARRFYPAVSRFMAYLRRTHNSTNPRSRDRTDHRQTDRTDHRSSDGTDHR